MRVAAVDCGTNSMRLLVADLRPASPRWVHVPDALGVDTTAEGAPNVRETSTQRVEVVGRWAPIIRLGEGLAETGCLGEPALARARVTAAEFAGHCREHRVERVAVAATAAARMAANGSKLLDLLTDAFAPWGAEPRIIEGQEEARLSFAGALSGPMQDAGPYLVVDSGGGSTELVVGSDAPEAALSVPLGCVTLHETLGWADPPTAADVESAMGQVAPRFRAALAEVGAGRARTLVALAGGATTLTAHALRLPAYDSARVDGARMPTVGLGEAARDMLSRSVAERANLPYLVPGREDVIGAAALIWLAIAEECGRLGVDRVVTSERDILDGLAMSLG